MRHTSTRVRCLSLLGATAALALGTAASAGPAAPEKPFLGKWDISPIDPAGNYGYWIEVRKDGEALTADFLSRNGSVTPTALVKVDKGELLFWTRGKDAPDESKPFARARLARGKLAGTFTPPDGKVIKWVGSRAPVWKKVSANAVHKLGKPVELFDGKTMEGWTVQFPDKPMGWSVEAGTMTNDKGANNIASKQKFKNYKVVAEYKLDKESNSGFYLRGRYELQIVDDAGKPADAHGSTAIYSRVAPAANAAKPPGEWQTLEATVVGNKVTVSLNGQKVHDDATLEGPTGGSYDVKEGEPGPVMIQGDHGKVWFRKVTVTPILGG